MNYQRLFQYNEETNGLFLDLLEQHPAAPESAVKWMSHIFNAMDIWLHRIQGRKSPLGVWELHPVSGLRDMNRMLYERYCELLEVENLARPCEYTNTKGETFSNTVEEMLTHVILHSMHHRAQIASALRSAGITPPPSDFIFWARR